MSRCCFSPSQLDEARRYAEALFETVRKLSRSSEGVTREAFGPVETETLASIEAAGHSIGLSARRDAAGNLWLERAGQAPASAKIVLGSHADSVPEGGNYDGLAGIAAGLTALFLLEKQGFTPEDIRKGNLKGLSLTIRDYHKLSEELQTGEITLRDVVKELEKPGRDPREEMPAPILRTDVLEMKDLKEGMVLKGTVRNVIDFGVFVDIGVHQDGLVHISEVTDKKFIRHPLEVVSVGDVVDVRVIGVDLKKKRIQLSMKGIS